MKLKKLLVSIIIFLTFLHGVATPWVILAEEGPTELSAETTPEPTPSVTLEEPTPTLTPTPTPEPEPTGAGVEASNSAEVNNDINSESDSGNNAINPTPTPTLSPTPTPEPLQNPETQNQSNNDGNNSCNNGSNDISTGSTVSSVFGQNDVNTSAINSSADNTTFNVTNGGQSIDLSSPLTPDSTGILTQDPQTNTGLVDITNGIDLTNEIDSSAISGYNQLDSNGNIITGDAISLISLINNVNLTLIDSTLQIITLNILGVVNGDIILPENTGQICSSCGTLTDVTNNATVNNTIDSQAISGQNTINGAKQATITTGDSISMVNLINLINTTFVGTNVTQIFINVFGSWNGDFLGWGDIDGSQGGVSMVISRVFQGDNPSCDNCEIDSNIENDAMVNNTISSEAISGQNAINGKKATIKTGNAYSLVSLVNMVNTTFVNSTGVFAFINIFGQLNGDIGGKSKFQASAQGGPQEEQKQDETGMGALAISNSNNVGNHVMPGDTVTFLITVTNPGSAKVENASVDLGLFKNNSDFGGGVFKIGEILPGHSVKLSTGMVLTKKANGYYAGSALATGTSRGHNLSAESSSYFKVNGFAYASEDGIGTNNDVSKVILADAKSISPVLPQKSQNGTNPLLLILALILAYFMVKALRNIEDISSALRSETLLVKLKSVQRILL